MNRPFGTTVSIEYCGYLDNGEVFDQSAEGKPLEVVLGQSMVPRGLENALLKMEVGEERLVVIEPQDGYGDYMAEARFEIPLNMLPQWRDLPVGEYIEWFGPKGNDRPAIAKVVAVTDQYAVIDLNHPLAGKTVSYKVKIVGEGGGIADFESLTPLDGQEEL